MGAQANISGNLATGDWVVNQTATLSACEQTFRWRGEATSTENHLKYSWGKNGWRRQIKCRAKPSYCVFFCSVDNLKHPWSSSAVKPKVYCLQGGPVLKKSAGGGINEIFIFVHFFLPLCKYLRQLVKRAGWMAQRNWANQHKQTVL